MWKERKYGHFFKVLFELPTAAILLSVLLRVCEPPAAYLVHSDEDDEAAPASPSVCLKQRDNHGIHTESIVSNEAYRESRDKEGLTQQ